MKIKSKVVALTLVSLLGVNSLTNYMPMQGVSVYAAQEDVDAAVQVLENAMKANMPEGQQWVSYTQNYESTQPEPLHTLQGDAVTNNVETGNNVIQMTSESAIVFENSPYLSSGIVKIEFSQNFEPVGEYQQVGFGLIIKGNSDTNKYMSIRLDANATSGSTAETPIVDWVVEGNDNDGISGYTWQNIKSSDFTPIEANQKYELTMAYHDDQLVIAMDGEIIYNGESTLLASGNYADVLGQIGIRKRFGAAEVKIDSISIEGVGTNEKPAPPTEPETKINYDYEDGEAGNWMMGAATAAAGAATIIEDPSNPDNNVLRLKGVADGRYYDSAAPELSDKGSISFDYQVINAANGFSFGFLMDHDSFNELGFAPHDQSWIFESGSTWSTQKVPVAVPAAGVWNNVIMNFDGDVVEVYMNDIYQGSFDWFDFQSTSGFYGFRLRNGEGGAELYLDNLTYSNLHQTPEPAIEYKNDYTELVSGVWSDVTATVVNDGGNQRLAISGLTDTNSEALLTDSGISIAEGTLFMDMKPQNKNTGIIFGNDSKAYFDGTKWVLMLSDGSTIDFEDSEGNQYEESLKVNQWNKIQLNVTPMSVQLGVNGEILTASLSATKVGEGTLGVYSEGNIAIDNLHYTNKVQTDSTYVEFTKYLYEEFYELESDMSVWSVPATQTSGRVSMDIAANSTATNSLVSTYDYGVYQIAYTAQDGLGATLGNLKFYHNGTSWGVQSEGGSFVELKEKEAPTAGELMTLRVELYEEGGKLLVNGATMGTFDLAAYDKTAGDFGLFNASGSSVTTEIEALGVEELRLFDEDFVDYTSEFEKLVGTNDVTSTIVEEKLNVTIGPVLTAIDNSTISTINSEVTFDFTPGVEHSNTGGRYGFVLRGKAGADNVIVETDINGLWRLSNGGITTNFNVSYPLELNETYQITLSLVDDSVSMSIGKDGEVTKMGTLPVSKDSMQSGYFGLKSWYAQKTLTFDNLKIKEIATIEPIQLPVTTTSISKDGMTVHLSESAPVIAGYDLYGKIVSVDEIGRGVIINGTNYVPNVTLTKINESKADYVLEFDELAVNMKASYEILDNNVVDFKITEITENGDFLVNTIALDGEIMSVNSLENANAGYAWTNSTGQWHGINEAIVSNLSEITVSDSINTTMAFMSTGEVALSVENNAVDGGAKVIVKQEKGTFTQEASLSNGVYLYRHELNDKETVEDFPHMEIVLTDNVNGDFIQDAEGNDTTTPLVDWQDGAVAHREYIYNEAFEAEDMQNSMMYIPFNFASNANDTFTNSLDTVKMLYNYTDGFGQMLLHKGYQDEGHDSGIPSYSNVGIRQGGVEDMQLLIEEGDQYNAKVGVHINATEYHTDATDLYYSNLSGATSTGVQDPVNASVGANGFDSLAPGWDWVDTTFYVDQTQDVITGELQRRFEDLYNQTAITDETGNAVLGKDGNPLGIDFYYIDVYTGNSYNANKLLEFANDLGVKIGTEFAGPLEPGSNFVHWGTDFGYPNKGNGSLVSRFVKNELDIFTGNALFKGQKLAVVSYWGDSKSDIEQGIFTFFNETLPTKFMQHYGVMKLEDNQVIFEDGVKSTRNEATGKIELTVDGNLVSSWTDTGTSTLETERHTAEAESLIPWAWDMATNEVLTLDEGAKLYHWNTSGAATTWTLTDKYAQASAYQLYELTQQGKVVVGDPIPVVDGKITITSAKENTGYVLYKVGVDAEGIVEDASNWGEGSEVLDFAFNSQEMNTDTAVWHSEAGTNATIAQTEGKGYYDTNKEMSQNRLENYLEIDANGGSVYQNFTVKENTNYNIGVWASTAVGREVTLEVEVDGKVYKTSHTGIDGTQMTNFKYRWDTYHLMQVDVAIPSGVTTATIRLMADEGNGVAKFDDVKVFEHIADEYAMSEEAQENYLVYEDFENVAQGYGILQYGVNGSLKMQLKTNYNFNTDEPFNDIVTAADETLGPIFTWVLDGKTSLKINETDAGKELRVAESALRLLPNEEYTVGFEYTAQDYANYKLQVISRSTGDIAFEENIPVAKSTGDGTGNEISYTFTTGDKDDYQIRFVKTNSGSQKTELHAFILDNFYVSGVEAIELDVSDGTGSGYYKAGEEITITAEDKGIAFDKWEIEGVSVSDLTQTSIAFTMPEHEVVAKATYHGEAYPITVVNGTTSLDSAYEGNEVVITANTAPVGHVFKGWTVEGISGLTLSEPTITFEMPNNAVSATANYEAIDYTITLTNASSTHTSANYNEQVTITADEPEQGYRFKDWTVEGISGVTLTDSTITFAMPATNVSATANYEAIKVTSITLDKTEVTLTQVGQKDTLTASVNPADALDPTITWTSSDESIVSVDANGVVEAQANGSVTITATSADGTVSATATITVDPSAHKYGVSVVNGTTTKAEAAANETVDVSAKAKINDLIFVGWQSTSEIVFDNPFALETSFMMIGEDVEVVAMYYEEAMLLDEEVENYEMGSKDVVDFRSEATYQTLQHVVVNEKVLIKDVDYVETQGSTIITFTPEYLSTLTVGEYDVTMIFTTNLATTGKIMVNEKTETPVNPTPPTGDTTQTTMLWIVFLAAGASVLTYRRRYKK